MSTIFDEAYRAGVKLAAANAMAEPPESRKQIGAPQAVGAPLRDLADQVTSEVFPKSVALRHAVTQMTSGERIRENENLQAGQTVALLTSGSQPEVQVAMPDVLISQVVEGAAVDVAFDSLPGDLFPAVITEVVTPRSASRSRLRSSNEVLPEPGEEMRLTASTPASVRRCRFAAAAASLRASRSSTPGISRGIPAPISTTSTPASIAPYSCGNVGACSFSR